MKTSILRTLLALLPLLGSPFARAHFPILIHDAGLGSTSGVVTITYATGHPFELEMEPAPRPDRLQCFDARGRATNLTTNIEATLFRGDPNGAAWQVQIEPARGDRLLALDSAPSVDADQKTVYREYVKVCLHRGLQGGWKQRTGQPLEIVPQTRPYGLRPGMTFSGRLLRGEAPVADTEIYFERLNERRPDAGSLPPEALITFVVRTNRDGEFTVSLPDAGWWVIGAYADDLGPVRHAGQDYRLEGFAGLWIRVEEPPHLPAATSATGP